MFTFVSGTKSTLLSQQSVSRQLGYCCWSRHISWLTDCFNWLALCVSVQICWQLCSGSNNVQRNWTLIVPKGSNYSRSCLLFSQAHFEARQWYRQGDKFAHSWNHSVEQEEDGNGWELAGEWVGCTGGKDRTGWHLILVACSRLHLVALSNLNSTLGARKRLRRATLIWPSEVSRVVVAETLVCCRPPSIGWGKKGGKKPFSLCSLKFWTANKAKAANELKKWGHQLSCLIEYLQLLTTWSWAQFTKIETITCGLICLTCNYNDSTGLQARSHCGPKGNQNMQLVAWAFFRVFVSLSLHFFLSFFSHSNEKL